MPPREPKGRMLTREYMADYDFQSQHSAEARETYLLLAMFADDAGWLEWEPEYLAGTMFRYDQRGRERFAADVESLQKAGRLVLHKCGHAEMPKVVHRPRPGVQERKVFEFHTTNCGRRRNSRKRSTSDPDRIHTPDQDHDLDLTNTNTNTNTSPTPRARPPARETVKDRNVGPQSLKDIVGWVPPGAE